MAATKKLARKRDQVLRRVAETMAGDDVRLDDFVRMICDDLRIPEGSPDYQRIVKLWNGRRAA